MLARLSYIQIGQYEYPMCFSLGCVCEYNSFGTAMENVKNDNNIEESAKAILNLLSLMIHAGTEYSNIVHLPKRKYSATRDGRYVCPTKSELGYLIPATKESLTIVGEKIKQCISESKSKEIQAVSSTIGKNGKKKRSKGMGSSI